MTWQPGSRAVTPPGTFYDDLRRQQTFHRGDLSNSYLEKNLWEAFLADRRDRFLAQALTDIYGRPVEQLQLPPSGRLMVVFPDGGVYLDLQGDGVRAAFRCLTLLVALENTLYTLEEPECHQHPGSLGRFAYALCSQAQKRGVQMILTTHSEECIDAFLKAAARVAESLPQGTTYDAAVFGLQLRDGVLDARRLTAKTAEQLERSGVDLRELDLYG